MRSLALSIILAAMVSAFGGAATAAPTCQGRLGQTVRCGTPGAMPVGWTAPAGQRAAMQDPDSLAPAQWFGLFALVGGLFAMIALMPDFDGFGDVEEDAEEPR